MDRLQKVIAQSGVASRRKAEQLITAGRVKVNGQTVTELGTKVTVRDEVTVDNVPLEKQQLVYFLLYKPTDVITSRRDDRNRKTVLDFFPHVPERIFPVGRLDYDTSGALLLTNDGTLAHHLMHPRFEIDKTYIAKVSPAPTPAQMRMLTSGIRLEDGMTAPATAAFVNDRRSGHSADVRLTLHEGRNRQIRRMFDALNLKVVSLKRERYGILDLTGLHPGESRRVKPHEVKALYQLVNGESRRAKPLRDSRNKTR